MMSNFEMIYLSTRNNVSGVWVSPTIEIFLVEVFCVLFTYTNNAIKNKNVSIDPNTTVKSLINAFCLKRCAVLSVMLLYWHVYWRHMCMTRPSTRVKFSEANDYYTHNIVNIYALGIFTLIKSQYYFFFM